MKKQNKNEAQQLPENNIVLYSDKHGNVELRADVEKDTMWTTQEQIVRLFDVDQSVVSRHIRNIIKDGEIDEKSNMQKMHNAFSDRPITLYSLDIILAVGYRTNSRKAVMFKKWATGILREYLVNGHALDRQALNSSTEKIQGLHEAVALLESPKYPGKVKGRLVLKVIKEMVERE